MSLTGFMKRMQLIAASMLAVNLDTQPKAIRVANIDNTGNPMTRAIVKGHPSTGIVTVMALVFPALVSVLNMNASFTRSANV